MDCIPESLLHENINISPIENMILEFDDNYETYQIVQIANIYQTKMPVFIVVLKLEKFVTTVDQLISFVLIILK